MGNIRRTLLAFLLAFLLCSSALAGDTRSLSPDTWGEGLPPVTDQADLLSNREEERLSARAEEICGKYGCAVYIIIMENYRDYTESRSLENCGDDIREGYNLGGRPDADSVILLHSLAERDYGILAHGDFGNASFTDYGKEVMAKPIVEKLKESDWYGAYTAYLDECERLLALSAKGKPLDISQGEILKENLADMGRNVRNAFRHFDILSFLYCCIPGAIFALIFTSIATGRLRSVQKKEDADEYQVQGSVVVTERSDQYTHTTTSSRDAPKSSRGGGGGGRGGTTTNSRGSSYSGGKY